MRTALLAFHGQHIRARRHGGSDDRDNLRSARVPRLQRAQGTEPHRYRPAFRRMCPTLQSP